VNGGLARHGHRRENVGGSVERNDGWNESAFTYQTVVKDRLRPRTA